MRMLRVGIPAELVLAVFVAVLAASGCTCDPGPGEGSILLLARTALPPPDQRVLGGGQGETLSDLRGLSVTVVRVDVVHRTDRDDPATERVITVNSETRDLQLLAGLADVPRILGHLAVPAGFVFQIRFVSSEARISLGRVPDPIVVRIPSGAQTGIKLVPVDGEPFEVRVGEKTGVRAIVNPFELLIFNRGIGFQERPVVPAERFDVVAETGLLANQVVVRFHDGTSQSEIDTEIAATGSTVLHLWRPTNYYTLAIPPTMPLGDALEYYHGRPSVAYVTPNTVLEVQQVDPQLGNQTQWPQVDIPGAWLLTLLPTGAVGSAQPVIAVVDTGVDVTHQDLINNVFINVAEIPANILSMVPDRNGDGLSTAVDLDVTGPAGAPDGVVTFADINAPANSALGICQVNFGPGPATVCDPLDLVSGEFTGPATSWEDGVDADDFDGDPQTFVDDLVGWNFSLVSATSINGGNLPVPVFCQGLLDEGCHHGTWVAGIIGAVGANGLDTAGVNWNVRILPVVPDYTAAGTVEERFPLIAAVAFRDSVYRSVLYAAAMGADAINASLGGYVMLAGEGTCAPQIGAYDVPRDKFDAFTSQLRAEVGDMYSSMGASLFVASAGNCNRNHDSAGLFEWPGSVGGAAVLRVAAVDGSDNLSSFSDFAVESVELAAPGEDFIMLRPFDATTNTCTTTTTVNRCDGTSFASPMVCGTVGLMLSFDPTLFGQPCRIADRIIRNADQGVGNLTGQVGTYGAGGLRLNVFNAVLDTVTSPARGCP